LTLTIVQSIQRILGRQTRRPGAAAFTTRVAPQQHRLRCLARFLHRCLHRCRCRSRCRCLRLSRSCQRGLQIHTIVPMASQIGRQAGLFRRKSGAAGFMARAAPTREAGARHHRSLTIAMRDSPIGRRVGVLRRRPGAVPTREKVALKQVEVALEPQHGVRLNHEAAPWGASSGVIGRYRLEYPAQVGTKPQRRRSRHLPALIRFALVEGVDMDMYSADM